MAFFVAIFFVATTVAKAQTQFVGPTAEPPGDNRPGYIFNILDNPDLGPQNASIDISGTTVGGARVIGDELCIGDEDNCIDGWDSSEIQDGDWFDQGTAIYTDASGVGVGTNSPTTLLEVADNSSPNKATIRVRNLVANPEFQLKFGGGANDHWALYVDNTASGPAQEALRIWGPQSDNALTIYPGGDVNLAHGLIVGDGIITSQIYASNGIIVGNSNSTDAGSIRWNGSQFQGYNGSEWTALGGGGGNSPWSVNGSSVYYSSGNVGVNTNAPGANLHVNGSVFFKGGSGDVNGNGRVDNADAVQISNYVRGNFTFTDAQKAIADVNGDAQVDNDDATIILAEFLGYDRREVEVLLQGAFNSELITTPSLGAYLNVPGRAHVGTGFDGSKKTSSGPSATLQVSGDILAENGLTLGNSNLTKAGTLRWNGSDFQGYDGSQWNTIGDGNSTNSSLWQQNGTNAYYTQGNVGIGVNNPTRALSIFAPKSELFELRNTATSDWMGIHLSGANTQIYSNDQIQYFSGNGTVAPWNGQHLFYGTNKVFLDQNGTVQQTFAADGRLIMTNENIEGVGHITINDSGANEGLSWAGTDAKIYVAPMTGDLNNDGYLRLINDGGISLEPGTEGDPAVTVRSDGRVGIGTQTPYYSLDVADDGGTNWMGRFYNLSNQARAYFANGSGYGMYLSPGNNTDENKYALYVTTSEGAFNLKGDGDLALGGSGNPTAQLHVRNDNVANDSNAIIGEYTWNQPHGNAITIRNGVIGSGGLNFSQTQFNSTSIDQNVLGVFGTYGQAYASGSPTTNNNAQIVLRGGNFTAFSDLGRSGNNYWLPRRHEGVVGAATGLADMNLGVYGVAGGGPGHNGVVNIGIYGKGDLGNCSGLPATDCRNMYDIPSSGDYAGYFDGNVTVTDRLTVKGSVWENLVLAGINPSLNGNVTHLTAGGDWGVWINGSLRADKRIRVGEIHGDAGFVTDSSDAMRFDSENGTFRWSNSNNVRMTLTNGNLGIGTQNTNGYRLNVNGSGFATSWESEKGDYAEWFEKEEVTVPGDIIGINLDTGKVRKYQSGDKFIGIHSTAAAFIGNKAEGISEETHTLVGLLGQVPFDEAQVEIRSRLVYTLDGIEVGVLLSDGRVLIGR